MVFRTTRYFLTESALLARPINTRETWLVWDWLGCAGGARPKSCRGGGKPTVGAVRGLWGPCGTWEGRELIAQHGNCPYCCRTDKHQRYWLQEPFGSPNVSLISSFILHHFFKQPQWKGLCILHENPKYCEELTSSPGHALLSLSDF